ncbi:MAG: hypothetical protein FJ405_11175, partial [Verrucomicrobia bacterium]|nr:hypothetical protein [Verrucomicrobiota bacterium]
MLLRVDKEKHQGIRVRHLVPWLRGVVVAIALLPGKALAHTESGVLGGVWSGFVHPLTGLDHFAAMVAVGLWGAFLGRPA